jgi:hypothetical protein
MALGLTGCGEDDGEGGGGSCDVVANAGWSNNFKVVNRLDTGLEWIIRTYPFGADMKPGECTIMGVSEGTHTVDFTQCDIGDAACISTFGSAVPVTFSVSGGETYSIEVTSDLF